MELALCTGHCHIEIGKGQTQSWEQTIISLYAAALRFPLIGIKEPKPNQETQSQTIYQHLRLQI